MCKQRAKFFCGTPWHAILVIFYCWARKAWSASSTKQANPRKHKLTGSTIFHKEPSCHLRGAKKCQLRGAIIERGWFKDHIGVQQAAQKKSGPHLFTICVILLQLSRHRARQPCLGNGSKGLPGGLVGTRHCLSGTYS